MIFRPVIQGSSQIVWSESSFFSRFYFFISAIFLSISQNHMQRTLNYYVHVLDADKIATATVMGMFSPEWFPPLVLELVLERLMRSQIT